MPAWSRPRRDPPGATETAAASKLHSSVVIGRSASPRILTIPSTDSAFRAHVERLRTRHAVRTPEHLEQRLRRLFPRVVVRERELSGEPMSWYVYRDGGWQGSGSGPWWAAAGLPRVSISADGWINDANAGARSLLGIEPGELGTRHLTDFVAPGTLDDATALLGIVDEGHDLTATILIRPTTGDVVAIDVHATREPSTVVAVLRLAENVPVEPVGPVAPPPTLRCEPAADPAFRGYALLALSRMPEPTQEGLALRLRRLYPHARVTTDGEDWLASRDADSDVGASPGWWLDPSLPRVRYDAQALIFEANDAARDLLGSSLVGHYWQEFVTPGSTEQVAAMLAILAEVGAAESRFRMPASDGSLVEFDSWTEVDGEHFTTVMRPR
jgi:PAS domain-containing protein